MAEMLVKPDQSSHWYKPDGTPCYEVPYADKKRVGEMRSTTLGDARKMGLYPSVTSILSVIAKEGLIAWKLEQMLLAALTITRLPDEPETSWVRRITDDAKDTSMRAADRGTRTHTAIQDWGHSGKITDDAEVFDSLLAYVGWHQAHVKRILHIETPFACEAGYGGRNDLVVELLNDDIAEIDLKTKTTKKGEPIKPYIEWGMQLAAYERGLILPENCRLLNVVLSTTEPNRLEVFEWTDKKNGLYHGFYQAFNLWKFLKDYDPTVKADRCKKYSKKFTL